MVSPSSPSNSIKQARHLFFDDGSDPRGLVPGSILASWQRCREMGLVANDYRSVTPVEQHALRVMQERYEQLRKLCRPELEALHTGVNRADSIVILAAPDGFILDALGSADFLDKAARVSLRPGVPWTESATGTNAVGTAIVERRSVEVLGAEHYYMPHKVLSCSATPILNPHGKVVGVLDLSGEASVHHRLALGMVQLAVEQIEHRLFESEFDSGDIVRIQSDPDLLGTAREGMLVFEDHKLVAANRRALRLLGIDWSELGKLRHHELFASALPRFGGISDMRCQDGKMMHARRDLPSRTYLSNRALKPGAKPASVPTSPVFSTEFDAELDRVVKLLDADIPLLLQGETGTGKEVVARELHRRGVRSAAPFVAVNCAALPESLIESELFGYLPGAFTGAKRDGAPGLLRQADGGTLFLDELGDMPLALQSRLLRVLQEREVTPLGGSRAFAIDVSVIAATHRDLGCAVACGEFRADLYYRVAQSVLHLPALCKQPDLAGLISRFWKALGSEKMSMYLDDDLVRELASMPWPGNIRQLISVLRTLMALGNAGTTLSQADLPHDLRVRQSITASATLAHASGDLHAIELHAIDAALASCDGNVTAAARKLGISRSTIYRRMSEESSAI
ncbi:MAG: sigma-54-dependent Fis family transcriptional regulator [Rhodanobacteraceae bacterium]|nr:MAG: sigma-54-dependent Fis family transcriptional regulator [Rhodanobacteraceae bacterium]